jgi:Tfp pilus assembly protein PilW
MLTRLRDRDDAGLTLAELIVSMTLMTILLMIGGTFFITAVRTTSTTTLTNQQTSDARITLDSWTAKLRVAAYLDSAQTDRIEVLTPSKIVFYANLNNRTTSNFSVGSVSKVVLMLKQTNATSGDGQLIEIIFSANSTTPTSVRRVALNARPIAGRQTAIFTAFNYIGAELNPASYTGCLSGTTVKSGLCLQALPAGAGTVDPTVGLTSNAVTAGTLAGNPASNVDSVLQSIVAIKIGFTVSNTADTVSQNYQSMVALNSGYAS